MVRYNQPISDGAVEELLNTPGVTSVGEGLHEGERAIVVGVENESVAERLPARIEGMQVVAEVEQRPGTAEGAGTPLLPEDRDDLPSTSVTFGGRHRPVPAGVSLAHIDSTAGTSSFFATDGDTIYQLSNSHVIAEYGAAEIGDEILQPGPADGGEEEDEVGTLAGNFPVSDQGNVLDIAWYDPGVPLEPDINQMDTPTIEIADPELGDEVTFVGRTSGVTTGTVDKVNVAVEVEDHEGNIRQFVDQFRLDTPFIPGDSGSPVVMDSDDGLVPAGVGFAGSDDKGYANYISNVEEETGLTILPIEGQEDDSPDRLQPGEPGVSREAIIALAVIGGGAAYLAYRRGS